MSKKPYKPKAGDVCEFKLWNIQVMITSPVKTNRGEYIAYSASDLDSDETIHWRCNLKDLTLIYRP